MGISNFRRGLLNSNYNDSDDDGNVNYFKLTALESGTFTFSAPGPTAELLNYMEYSIDNGETWVRTVNNGSGITITTPTINSGDSVLWRGSGTRLSYYNAGGLTGSLTHFSSTCLCNVSGKLNTLALLDKPKNIMDIYMYRGLFFRMTTLVDASNLIFPSITTSLCYDYMFDGCTALINPPLILPAKTLSSYCYRDMFRGCTSLTSVPELPATTLGGSCYDEMFMDCTSLTTIPESLLPAKKLVGYCYNNMFAHCTSLATAPALPATTLASYCYLGMFSGCTALTTAPELPAITLADSCYKYMFKDCTSLTTAPELPAIDIESGSYNNLFENCSSLNYIKVAGVKILDSSNWISGVAETGTIVKHPLASYTIPPGWNVLIDINYITQFNPLHTFNPEGYVTITPLEKIYLGFICKSTYQTLYVSKDKFNWHNLQSNDCIEFNEGEIFYLCGFLNGELTSGNYTNIKISGRFSMSGNCNSIWNYNNLNAPLKSNCGLYLFYYCNGLTNLLGFSLPATTLTSYCYYGMFLGCTSLTVAPGLPATTLANYCYLYMFQGCTSLTTATELPATTLASSCYHAMFANCTSLTTAPVLSATTLASYSCAYMFANCTSLTTAPELIAAELVDHCYYYMFSGCSNLNYIKAMFLTQIPLSATYTNYWVKDVASTGTFYKYPSTDIAVDDSGIPNGWTVVEDFSVVTEFNPLETLTPSGYLTLEHSDTIYLGLSNKASGQTMYVSKDGSTWHNLKRVDILEFSSNENCYICGNNTSGAGTSNYTQIYIGGSNVSIKGNCNSIWSYNDLNASLKSGLGTYLFRNCKKLIDASDLTLPSTVVTSNCYYGMFLGCESLVSAPQELPATEFNSTTSTCYHRMFSGCTSLINPPRINANSVLAASEYCGYMFENCTSLTKAPDLLIETIPSSYYTYYNMFNGCTSLNYVKALFLSIPTRSSFFTRDWMEGVSSSTGIFVKNIKTTWTSNYDQDSCFPVEWTVLYFDTETEKYYLSDKTTECDDHGNIINTN